jgi:serine/threonine protein phosphatase PrpC
MKKHAYAATDIGLKRKINQDAFLKDDDLGLYVVADGMGGHRGGEVASRLAVECIQRFCRDNRNLPARDILDQGINLSSQEIYQQSQDHEELSGMGTTVLALLFQEDVAYIGQVGDSRAYLMNDTGIWQITEDHSLLNEEIRAGRLAAGQASNYQFKNVITRSVGYEKQVTVDIYRRKASPADIYIMCSDGLSGLVDINEIGDEILKSGPEQGLTNLIALANARGGDDNITVLICQLS